MMTRILFMGRKEVSAEILSWLIDQPNVIIVGAVTDSHLQVSPVRELCKRKSIPILTLENVEKLIKTEDLKFDLGVSILFWRKIKESVINSCEKGIINFHPAPLPDYKGTAGYNLAILESHNRWAVTAHYIDEEIDTGPIIELEYFEINHNSETALSLERKTQPVIFSLAKNILSSAINTKVKLHAERIPGGRYISRQEMEDMKTITNSDDIDKKIRAFWFPPYDGANIIINGNKYTLINQEILKTLSDPKASNIFSQLSDDRDTNK